MNASERKPGRTLQRAVAVTVLVAAGFAILLTAGGWFLVGTWSPLNRGVAPDFSEQPFVTLWVIATLPAAMLFTNLFGKQGSEAAYFLCVFIQWLAIGLPIGTTFAAVLSRLRGRKEVTDMA